MHEDQLRALIRDAIAQHLGSDGRAAMPGRPFADPPRGHPSSLTHVSHGKFVFLAPTEPDAPCVVEPHVRCHHCGFCQSYGH